MQDHFRFYEDNEFIKRYCFRKTSVMDVLLPLVFNRLAKNNNRGLPIAPVIQLLIALRFYATGNFQGHFSIHSITCNKKYLWHWQKTRNFVKFPETLHEQQENIMKFYNVANFPNVAACVDCTHITIGNPGGEIGEIFRNRKRQFSLNVQVASGPNMEILDIDVRYPGSTHDSVIFDRSALRVRFETRQIEGILLGDNGYACQTYLLTPVVNPGPEQNYNRSHISTRNIVERLFGAWKRRFPCLRRVLLTKLETSVAVICATAVLYNIARNIQEDDFEDNNNELPPEDNIIIEANDDGLAFRRAFIAIHFQ
ncbi:hypothetical protein NQ314_018547 [Rhamnusium bicolor]|uniref:DDE Tnp4 domain-containing protein n=1 Tax=Rhamnusium bicolor TaxID=1586634 RepID=A0AAV8WRK4_9CUCU|nr:hypothetical protein NQ314_018547 [Rhamnusium bicolor]